jgi:hypothetical protein
LLGLSENVSTDAEGHYPVGDIEFYGEGQFSNPYVFRGLVQVGVRVNYPSTRIKLADWVLSESKSLCLATRLALHTVIIYASMDLDNSGVSNRLAEAEALLALSPPSDFESNKAVYRWLVSLTFAVAHRHKFEDNLPRAVEWYQRVLDSRPTFSSVLLESKRIYALRMIIQISSDNPMHSPRWALDKLNDIKSDINRIVVQRGDQYFSNQPSFWCAEFAELFDGLSEIQGLIESEAASESSWRGPPSFPLKRFGLFDLSCRLLRDNSALDRANRELNAINSKVDEVKRRQRFFITRLLSRPDSPVSIRERVQTILHLRLLRQCKEIYVFGSGDVASHVSESFRLVLGEPLQQITSKDLDFDCLLDDGTTHLLYGERFCLVYCPFEPLRVSLDWTGGFDAGQSYVIDFHWGS